MSRRVHPVIGDLRQPLLGLTDEQVSELEGTIDHFFHLAAVYDMTAPRWSSTRRSTSAAPTTRWNWQGRCGSGRLHHVSSIAVAGAYKGEFSEDCFDEGQRLPSPYHATKFEAERIVREQVHVPWRVYRPGVVVGRLEDRRDGQDRRSLLLLQGDPADAPGGAAVDAARGPGPGQDERRAGGLGGGRARPHRPPPAPRRESLPPDISGGSARGRGDERHRGRRARAALCGEHRQARARRRADRRRCRC